VHGERCEARRGGVLHSGWEWCLLANKVGRAQIPSIDSPSNVAYCDNRASMAQGWVDVEDSKLGLREPSCLLLDPNFGFALLLLRLVRLPGRREQARPPCVSGFEEKILRGDHHRTSHSSWDVNQRHL
jgi:hypothetical protein